MSHEDNTCHHGNATTSSHRMFTEAQLQALIDQGRLLACYYAELDAQQKQGGDHSQCQPINFKGTEGVVGQDPLGHKKMESVFLISNCAITSQVKFASCTLQGSALTWWNSHIDCHKAEEWISQGIGLEKKCGSKSYMLWGSAVELTRTLIFSRTLIFHGDGSNNGQRVPIETSSRVLSTKVFAVGSSYLLAQVYYERGEDKSAGEATEEYQ
ncbi:hypothetical protein Tco_1493751 [Tanacetum coccineum]